MEGKGKEGNDLAMGGARQCQSDHVRIQVTRKKKNGAGRDWGTGVLPPTLRACTSVETLRDPTRHLWPVLHSTAV